MEESKHSGSLTIEHVSNGYILTTGVGGRSVAANEGEALKVISGMFKTSLPAQGYSCTVKIEVIKQQGPENGGQAQ